MNYDNSNKDKSNSPQSKGGLGEVQLKVCGMKSNTLEVAELQPVYLGFIFWEPSERYFTGEIPPLSNDIKKVGVFVDATIEAISAKVVQYDLWGVQLHGAESAEFCKELKENFMSSQAEIAIIKVFSIKDNFDFGQLAAYEDACEFYLFDTKGKLPGGNGYTFNWEVLKNYPSSKPYFLSGGIGLAEIDAVKEFMKRPEAQYCQVIDVNSKFETEPGLKDVEQLKKFKKSIEN